MIEMKIKVKIEVDETGGTNGIETNIRFQFKNLVLHNFGDQTDR